MKNRYWEKRCSDDLEHFRTEFPSRRGREDRTMISPNIFILDDEPMVVDSLRELIELETDYTAMTSTRPFDALSLLGDYKANVIISDFLMPEMNGIDFLLEAKKVTDNASMIILTGYADKANAIRAINEVGIYQYVEKPWDNKDLLIVIKNAVERGGLLQELRKRYHAIRDAYVETVYRLSIAAEIYDNNTYAHVLRIARLTKKLAELAGEDSEFCFNIQYASMMHDVGKIGVPREVLNKQGALDEMEFDLIKKHPAIGAHILRNAENQLMKMAHDIALFHHEKASGRGYPKGLPLEEIPKAARIVAVTDAFDAMMSARVYKKAFPPEKVRRIFDEDGGRHFDPELASLLLENFHQFVDIYTNTVCTETEALSHLLFENTLAQQS
jgi:putative two-component system response regulator